MAGVTESNKHFFLFFYKVVKYPKICQLIGRGVNLFGQTCIFMHCTTHFYTFSSVLWAFVVGKLITG